MAALKSGDLPGAQARFRAALDLDHAVTPAAVNLGDALERQDRHEDAVRTWEGVIESTPDRAHLVLERLRAAYDTDQQPDRFLDLCRRRIYH
jgi:lipopolysaccharide biosynthesis regulator YciM